MKKSTIIMSSLAVLVGTWLGGTWYSGKLVAEKYTHYIEEANKNIAQINNTTPYKIVFKNNKYERHFFDTEIEDIITITDTNSDTSYVIPFQTKLEHGPFPISRLLSLKWLPVMVSGTYEIGKDPSLETIFAATNQQPPLKAAFSLGYNEKVTQTIAVAGFNYESSKEHIQFHSTPFSINSNTDLQGIGQIDATIPSIQIKTESDYDDALNTLVLNGITIKTDQATTQYPSINSGTQYIKIDNIQINENHKNSLVLKGISSDSAIDLNNNVVDATSKFAIDELIAQKQNFGKFVIDVAFNHLDAKPLSQLLSSIQNMSLTDNPPNELTAQQAQWGKEIITNQPEFVIKQFSLTNGAGKNKLTANIKLANLTNVSPEQLVMQGNPLAAFQQIDVHTNLNKPALIDTLASIFQVEHGNISHDIAEKQAQSHIEEFLDFATSTNKLTTKDNVTYTQNITLDNGELKMNGEIIPKEQIAQQLALFLMTFGH